MFQESLHNCYRSDLFTFSPKTGIFYARRFNHSAKILDKEGIFDNLQSVELFILISIQFCPILHFLLAFFMHYFCLLLEKSFLQRSKVLCSLAWGGWLRLAANQRRVLASRDPILASVLSALFTSKSCAFSD